MFLRNVFLLNHYTGEYGHLLTSVTKLQCFEIFVLTFDRQNKDEGKKPEVKKVEKKRG